MKKSIILCTLALVLLFTAACGSETGRDDGAASSGETVSEKTDSSVTSSETESVEKTVEDGKADVDYDAVKGEPLDEFTGRNWKYRSPDGKYYYVKFGLSADENGEQYNSVSVDVENPKAPSDELMYAGTFGKYTAENGVFTAELETEGQPVSLKYSYSVSENILTMKRLSGGNAWFFDDEKPKDIKLSPLVAESFGGLLETYALTKYNDVEKAYSLGFKEMTEAYCSLTAYCDDFEKGYVLYTENQLKQLTSALFNKTEIKDCFEKVDGKYRIDINKELLNYTAVTELVEDGEISLSVYSMKSGVRYVWLADYTANESNTFGISITSINRMYMFTA